MSRVYRLRQFLCMPERKRWTRRIANANVMIRGIVVRWPLRNTLKIKIDQKVPKSQKLTTTTLPQ